MLIKTSNPVMKIFTGSTSHQTKPMKQSPRGLRPFDLGEVGLGIAAALENSGDEPPVNRALFSRNLSRGKKVPINSSKVSGQIATESNSFDDEEYTVVTCRDPKESYTKVYFNKNNNNNNNNNNNVGEHSRTTSVFHISPATNVDSAGDFPTSDFLSSCNMCQKKLHGQDIYMYRGEKAFCSTECRYDQIVIDERTEKYYGKEASRKAVVDVSSSSSSSSSPYVNGQKQMFATGILAT